MAACPTARSQDHQSPKAACEKMKDRFHNLRRAYPVIGLTPSRRVLTIIQ
jgi:hypothetical protein